MPWRIPPADHAKGIRANPYHVWLSEVMLQQTQVTTVGKYFSEFINRWPTIEALARADEADVLKAWAGLGYYARARRLKQCAGEIMQCHNGCLPENSDALKQLPGIGEYTAAAIAAIAFDEPVAVIDGNVERVMARLYRIKTPFPKAKPAVKHLLDEILDQARPGEFAQAMMDLGATMCTPNNPQCSACPLCEPCQGYQVDEIRELPHKTPKKPKPARIGAAFVIERRDGAIFLKTRGDKGLLAGMSEVPTTGWTHRVNGKTGKAAAPFKSDWQFKGTVRHTFTHFHLELEVWHTVFDGEPNEEGWWSSPDELPNEALPSVMRKVIAIAG